MHGTTPLLIASTLVWLVLGYAFYCWVYAAAGSTASRQDQVQSLTLNPTGYTAAGATGPNGLCRSRDVGRSLEDFPGRTGMQTDRHGRVKRLVERQWLD